MAKTQGLAAKAEALLASQRKTLTTFAKKEVVIALSLAKQLGMMAERDYNELLKWGKAMKKAEKTGGTKKKARAKKKG